MEGSVALAHQTKSYLLADAANPKPTRVLDGWDKAWHSLPVYDLNWFKYLADFVNDEPIRKQDKVMIGMLATLGIEKGKPFNPDARTAKILEAAIREAYGIMQQGCVTPGKALTAWWPDRQWMNISPAMLKNMGEGWSFDTADAVWTYDRAIAPLFLGKLSAKENGGATAVLDGPA